MKPRTVTLSDAIRRIAVLLERVAEHGEAFAVSRDGRLIAEIAPAVPGVATLGSLRDAIAKIGPVDEEFARDLEQIRAEQPALPEDPWPS